MKLMPFFFGEVAGFLCSLVCPLLKRILYLHLFNRPKTHNGTTIIIHCFNFIFPTIPRTMSIFKKDAICCVHQRFIAVYLSPNIPIGGLSTFILQEFFPPLTFRSLH